MIFDCDSTLSTIEGIDELAAGHREAIAPLTEAAMRGDVPLEAVYGQRLAIIRPTRAALDAVGALYVDRLVPGASETVRALQDAGVEVRIVSGGLRPAVLHVSRALGVKESHVFAVDVFFDAAGRYDGYDESSPLARKGGKRTLIETWRDLARPAMIVGDGATDLEARPAVDCFVAFAGIVERPAVVVAADVVVRDVSLLPVLRLVLNADSAAASNAPPWDQPDRAPRV